MTNEVYTEDLARFGSRERSMLADILNQPLPDTFSNVGVKPAMNMNSGYVFLVNEDYQTAMINCDTGFLEIFHSTPYEGHEGFITDLLEELEPDDLNQDDIDYILEMAEQEQAPITKAWENAEKSY